MRSRYSVSYRRSCAKNERAPGINHLMTPEAAEYVDRKADQGFDWFVDVDNKLVLLCKQGRDVRRRQSTILL